MENEFDFDSENAEFDDFDSEIADMNEGFEDFFHEDDDLGLEEIEIRTAVLQKNNMLALLCMKTATQGGAICRVDPREPNPSVQLYDDPQKALEWFTKSLRTSRKNGWAVVYDGLPLRG